ncbi:hypothetical protein GH714_038795 [Hevea brasiliensis]|uniref:DYW domain-containing protein n=1 Tax=Hevea brasiliensis TaxID=3981 RepID=A0A6A6KVZ2_HEVBR|nr:hypothetical protein GH714_038795 [Hevea brasiliensis]
MQEKRISKKPGYSLLTVDEEIHEFVSGDSSHPESEEIRKFLVCIIDSFRDEGYTPHTSNVFHDIDEEEKEHSLSYHSEKLAVAFALLRFKDRRTIRIMKNVRTCRDCHCFLKHVSGKFDKEIIVRDRNRFHHFSNGTCSCQDYCLNFCLGLDSTKVEAHCASVRTSRPPNLAAKELMALVL